MNISIWFSWPAGFGINTCWILVWNLMSQLWYNVYWDKEYQSIIKWWNNTFILNISDKELSISKKVDYRIAMDKYSIEYNNKTYELKEIIEIFDPKIKEKNIFAVGIAMFLLCGNSKLMLEFLEKKLSKKPNYNAIKQAFEEWIEYGKQNIQSTWNEFCKIKAGKPKQFMFWNQLIAKWAFESELEYYSFYPMTPATSISSELYKLKEVKENELTVFQWENEISVSMSVLWASFGWKRAMCASSGWWFALMVESISFAYWAEIPSVYVFCQRDGPSTWSPTFHSQWDLWFALNPSFWDIEPIVVYPSNYEEWYNLIWKALNRSQIYQTPIIFMSDKQFSECYYSVDKDDLISEKVNRGKQEKNPKEDYARYKLTEDWISPYTIPWTQNWDYLTTSYEHAEHSETTEDPNMKQKMTEKRAKKFETFIKKEYSEDFQGYEIINKDANKFYVSFGINSLVLQEYVKNNPEWGLILVKVLKPLNISLKSFFEENIEKIKTLKFVEHNHWWHFEKHIRWECELYWKERKWKIENLRKYDLYPFFIEDIN